MSDLRTEFSKLKPFFAERLPNACQNCESDTDLHVHHIVPLALGGRNILSNLAVLCGVCHGKIHGIDIKKSHGNAVLAGRKRSAKVGKWSAGRLPYGFDIDRNSNLITNDSEADIVRLIYKWRFEDRLTLPQIILILNEMAVPTKHDGQWRASSLRGILENPLYVGDYYMSGELIGKLDTAIITEEYLPIKGRVRATKVIEVA